MFWYFVGAFVLLVLAFIVWRYTSVARGARQRDEKLFALIEPLAEQLAAGESPSPQQVQELAQNPPLRHFVFEILKHYERLDLFPAKYRDEVAQAESRLVYWMLHPNELQSAPQDIELTETVTRKFDGRASRFHVFRYRMPEGHWAGQDWLLGLAGPYFDNDLPYAGPAGGFSRCEDKYGEVQPHELVDWYIDICTQKFDLRQD